ncbi:MAG: hypothetical protein Q9173_001298 [Seirophora scorigena]
MRLSILISILLPFLINAQLQCSGRSYVDIPRIRDCAIAISYMPRAYGRMTFSASTQSLPINFDGLKCRVTVSLDPPATRAQSSWLDINIAATQAMMGCMIFNGPASLYDRYLHRTAGTTLVDPVSSIRITIGKPGLMEGPAERVLWQRVSSPSARSDELSSSIGPEINGIGIGILESSAELVPDRKFLVTGLQVLEDIYSKHRNYDEVATNYVYTTGGHDFVPNFEALNISVVGRGREAGLPITFDNGVLALFVRFLGQWTPRPPGPAFNGQANRWCRIQCQFSWQQENGTESLQGAPPDSFLGIRRHEMHSKRSLWKTNKV